MHVLLKATVSRMRAFTMVMHASHLTCGQACEVCQGAHVPQRTPHPHIIIAAVDI
jgi:hypothetical protein